MPLQAHELETCSTGYVLEIHWQQHVLLMTDRLTHFFRRGTRHSTVSPFTLMAGVSPRERERERERGTRPKEEREGERDRMRGRERARQRETERLQRERERERLPLTLQLR